MDWLGQGVQGEDCGPKGRCFRVGGIGQHVELPVGVMDDGDGLSMGGTDGPVLTEEIDGMIGVESASAMEGQVEIQERGARGLPQRGTIFLEGLIPGVVGNEPSCAADIVGVIVSDLILEERIGLVVIVNAFVGQERHEAFLKVAEAPLDLAFGWRVRGDPMGDTQGREGSLELGMGVQTIGSGGMAKEGQAVSIEGCRRAGILQNGADQTEVFPGGIRCESPGHDSSGVIVDCKD